MNLSQTNTCVKTNKQSCQRSRDYFFRGVKDLCFFYCSANRMMVVSLSHNEANLVFVSLKETDSGEYTCKCEELNLQENVRVKVKGYSKSLRKPLQPALSLLFLGLFQRSTAARRCSSARRGTASASITCAMAGPTVKTASMSPS